MIELKDPILEKNYKLAFKDAFKKVSVFMESYSIITSDINIGKIVIEASYPYTMIFWGTWIKHIIVQLKKKNENITSIEIYGKPVISPHNFFKIWYFRKIGIDVSRFERDFLTSLHEYEI